MNNPTMKCTRQRLQWGTRQILVPAAMLSPRRLSRRRWS